MVDAIGYLKSEELCAFLVQIFDDGASSRGPPLYVGRLLLQCLHMAVSVSSNTSGLLLVLSTPTVMA